VVHKTYEYWVAILCRHVRSNLQHTSFKKTLFQFPTLKEKDARRGTLVAHSNTIPMSRNTPVVL
jgi:hypothetical protein